jgi:hypothetical protein
MFSAQQFLANTNHVEQLCTKQWQAQLIPESVSVFLRRAGKSTALEVARWVGYHCMSYRSGYHVEYRSCLKEAQSKVLVLTSSTNPQSSQRSSKEDQEKVPDSSAVGRCDLEVGLIRQYPACVQG